VSGYLEDLAPHLDGKDVALLLAFLEQMEREMQEDALRRYSFTRDAEGYTLRVTFLEGGLIVGRGVTISEAVKSLSSELIREGLKGAGRG